MKNKVTRIICVGISVTMVLTIVLGCLTFLVNCGSGKKKISKVEINNLDIYYLPTSTVDFDSVTITVTYNDDSVEEMKVKEIDVSDKDADAGTEFILNTDGLAGQVASGSAISEGNYEISCSIPSYKYKSGTLRTVTVGSSYSSDLTPLYYDRPALLDSYTNNLKDYTGKEDAEDSFYNAPGGYFVGDDNAFTFKPEFVVMNNKTLETGTFSGFDKDVTVKLVDDVTNADGAALNLDDNDYVGLDGFDFDFTENAIGKTFNIEISAPYGFSSSVYGNSFSGFSMDVTVADGWNVTGATDLGKMALVGKSFNRSDYVNGNDEKSINGGEPAKIYWDEESGEMVGKDTSDIWKEFLEKKGYTDLNPVNGIFLHSDITVTQKDLPEDFFISEAEAKRFGVNYDEMVGSVRDGVRIYEKNVEEDFTFDGNLFTVDCSSLKWAMTHLSSDFELTRYSKAATAYRESSIVLFGFQGPTSKKTENRATAVMRNVKARGNGIDMDDIEGKAAGSVRFVESRSSQTKVDNCIVREFLSAFSAKNSDDSYVNLDIDHVKIYDGYNFALIVSKSERNLVSNSDFERFSCPAITLMSDEKNEDGVGEHSYSKAGVIIDDNTTISSPLNGTEAWWTTNGAGAVATYLTYADLLLVGPSTNYTKTLLNEDGKLNMIGVFQDTEYFGQGGVKLNTYYRYGDGVPYILNGTVWDSSMSADVTGEEKGLYNAAVTNYFIASGVNPYVAMTFVTNQGTLCAMDGLNGFFDPLDVVSFREADPEFIYPMSEDMKIELDDGDDQMYIYYNMAGVGLCIIVDLYDVPDTSGLA
ncbi:MAG: hypothetical protein LUD47_03705 [Clostridia bacterium]|nr:hypothetical protein [Clostridia bacterium]